MVVTLIEWEKLGNGKWKKKNLYVTGNVHTKRKINSRGFLNRLFTIVQYRLKLLMTSIIF